jgi:putative NADH-flavin reductase
MKVPHLIRQGDVICIEVESIPVGAQDVTPEGDVILAYGEVTGHAHRIVQTKEAPKVRVWSAGAERFLQVVSAAPLTHEEHATIVLDRPLYKQVYQVEERGEEVRRVAAFDHPAFISSRVV